MYSALLFFFLGSFLKCLPSTSSWLLFFFVTVCFLVCMYNLYNLHIHKVFTFRIVTIGGFSPPPIDYVNRVEMTSHHPPPHSMSPRESNHPSSDTWRKRKIRSQILYVYEKRKRKKHQRNYFQHFFFIIIIIILLVVQSFSSRK